MNKNQNISDLRILICGLGSIGKRHMENLESLGIPCENIAVYRTRKGTASFGDEVLKKHKNRHPICYEPDLPYALKRYKPNIAFITNPTSLHVPTALKCAKAGCHLFVEKPIWNKDDSQLDELISIVGEKNLVAYVGYQLRFHPALNQIKLWLEENAIGKVISIQAEVSRDVTTMHKWEDYRASYTSRADLGGGVILTQSHELDYLLYLFSMPDWIFAAGGKLSPNLGIDVEDTAVITMQLKSSMICSLYMDYHKMPPERWLEITGTKGRIFWDLKEETLKLILPTKITNINIKIDKNDLYMAQIQEFLNYIQNPQQIGTKGASLYEGKIVLQMALAIKKSMLTQKKVNILAI